MRAIWRIEPWTGALSLDVSIAWASLDRLWPGFDVEAATTFLFSFEAGAVTGWSRQLALRKTRS